MLCRFSFKKISILTGRDGREEQEKIAKRYLYHYLHFKRNEENKIRSRNTDKTGQGAKPEIDEMLNSMIYNTRLEELKKFRKKYFYANDAFKKILEELSNYIRNPMCKETNKDRFNFRYFAMIYHNLFDILEENIDKKLDSSF